jgi:hypothetical protein
LNPTICSAQASLGIPITFQYRKRKKGYSIFVKAYIEEKEGLEAEVEGFDFLISTKDLIVIVVIMFIKFFQCSKCCST